MKAVIGLGIVLAATAAHADPPGMTPAVAPSVDSDNDPDDAVDPRIAAVGSDTSRVMVGAGAVMFAAYPNGIEDDTFSVVVGKPLWLGQRKAHFQWALDATLIAGYGSYSHAGQVAVLPSFGFNMYWGRRVGVEARTGPAGFAQLGKRSELGLGLGVSGAFVIRPFSDDRQRIKLWATMNMGFSLSNDAMNDSIGAGAMGGGVGYETPY